MAIKIGIIEDDEALREGLKLAFELEGYKAVCAGTMREGWEMFEKKRCDLAILDCSLPDGNGFDLLKRLRERSDLPVLMLTARNSEMDEIKGLELGVNDFMKKPFSLAVLQARVRKILKSKEKADLLFSNGISVDRKSGEVRRNGEKLSLSATEQRLLVLFLTHRGQILSKEQILSKIWDLDGNFVDENTLAVSIRRLRIKIEEDPGNPKRIRTVHGMGYIWQEMQE